MGRRSKGQIHSKKGKNLKSIKDKIMDAFTGAPNKILNYKQLSARLGYTSSADKNLVIKSDWRFKSG